MKETWAAWKRFWRVVGLFVNIFWSFYSLRFTRLWHGKAWAVRRREELWTEQARHFRATAVDMGGLLVKLGQFFSTRVDILPSQTVRELENLQDEVEGVPYPDIEKVVETELGRPVNELFDSFEQEAIAAASLGQVHRAFLKTGEEVAVKVLRPGIEDLIAIDLKAIYQVIQLLKRFTDWDRYMDLDLIYEEFRDTVREELDYLQEGKHAEIIAKNNHSAQLLIPAIYWEYTTQRVLTMQFMHGIKITDYEELDRAGVNREDIARLLVQVYCQQVFVDGFFHADPHPGNLFVTPEGQLIMVDFGMMGTVTPELREQITELALAAVRRDHLQVVRYLQEMGFLLSNAHEDTVARAIGIMLERFLGSGQSMTDEDLMHLLGDLEELLYEQPFQIPGNYTFLGRAAGTLYGLCIGLYPSINFLDEMKPYLEKFVGGKRGLFSRLRQESKDYVHTLLDLPPLTSRVLHRLEDGKIEVNVNLQALVDAQRDTQRALHSFGMVFLFGFVLLASVYLMVNGWEAYARWGLLVSFILLLIYWRSMRRERKHSLQHPDFIPRRNR